MKRQAHKYARGAASKEVMAVRVEGANRALTAYIYPCLRAGCECQLVLVEEGIRSLKRYRAGAGKALEMSPPPCTGRSEAA